MRASSLAARPGSILLAVVVAFLVFTVAYVAFASAQTTHAQRVWADYGKLQAIYAAESAVFAAAANDAAVAETVLWSDGTSTARYVATREAASSPCWITGTGTFVTAGGTYAATVRGYQVGSKIMLWDFGK